MAPKTVRKSVNDERAPLPIDNQARRAARITLTIGLVLVGIWIAWDFLAPLGWAVVIVLTTWPVYRKFLGELAGRSPYWPRCFSRS